MFAKLQCKKIKKLNFKTKLSMKKFFKAISSTPRPKKKVRKKMKIWPWPRLSRP